LVLLANVDLDLECSLGGGERHLGLGSRALIRAPSNGEESLLDTSILGLVGEVNDGESWSISCSENLDELRPDVLLECSGNGGITLRLQLRVGVSLIRNDRLTIDLEGGEEVLAVVLAKLIDVSESLRGGGDTRLNEKIQRQKQRQRQRQTQTRDSNTIKHNGNTNNTKI